MAEPPAGTVDVSVNCTKSPASIVVKSDVKFASGAHVRPLQASSAIPNHHEPFNGCVTP